VKPISKTPEGFWLRIRQLDNSLRPFKNLQRSDLPSRSWIREMRKTLGMKAHDLATRTGWAESTVPAIERSEQRGAITINSLKKAANAMDCDLVYAFVPRGSLEETVRGQIHKVAARRFNRVSQTMALEGQRLTQSTEDQQFADLVQRLTLKPPRALWAEP
jgi:predicted DNA-binding mobile mystery protein A